MTRYSFRPIALRLSVSITARHGCRCGCCTPCGARERGPPRPRPRPGPPIPRSPGAAVRVQGHEVRQGRGLQHGPGAVGQRRHDATLAAPAADQDRRLPRNAGETPSRPSSAVRSPRSAGAEAPRPGGCSLSSGPMSASAARQRPMSRRVTEDVQEGSRRNRRYHRLLDGKDACVDCARMGLSVRRSGGSRVAVDGSAMSCGACSRRADDRPAAWSCAASGNS